ncbi:hypothetical protein MPH_06467, partial [Macrophomina phaseolina MS6]
ANDNRANLYAHFQMGDLMSVYPLEQQRRRWWSGSFTYVTRVYHVFMQILKSQRTSVSRHQQTICALDSLHLNEASWDEGSRASHSGLPVNNSSSYKHISFLI